MKRSKNRKTGVRNPGGKPLPADSSAPISSTRKWLYRLVAMVVMPLALLAGLEISLRVAGYGKPFHFFKQITIEGIPYLVNDDLFGAKFFPPEMTRSPSAFRMEAHKPPGVCRIFIFGESAAMGDPEPAFGAGRYLEVLLRERYPGQKFEIINTGITGINSHVIVPIARECAHHEGDAWIIYMGNNEMVGPFGAATVFGAQAPPVAFVRLSLAIQQTRVGQLLLMLGRKLKGKSDSGAAWGGMQMFVENKIDPDDRRRAVVHQNFARNLDDIVRAGLDSGAEILLSTVAVNLKDCPPFASLEPTNLPAADADSYLKKRKDATWAESKSDFTTAKLALTQALQFAPQSAELHFDLGSCALQLSDLPAAREHLQDACDFDTLPFRADSHINAIITNAADHFAGKKLVLFDAENALAKNNPTKLCGHETFYEHVHFNFDGNYRLALLWAEQIASMFPMLATNRAGTSWVSQETCEERLGLTDWNRAAVVESVIQRLYAPPLNSQAGNAQRVEYLRAWAKNIRSRMTVEAVDHAREIYEDAIKHAPDDYFLHENYAAFLLAMHQPAQAAEQWRLVRKLMPQDFIADYRLAEVLVDQDDFAEAESLLHAALSAHPGFTEGWLKLGQLHAKQGKLDLALTELNRSRKLTPQNSLTAYELGRVYSRLNRSDDSVASFHEALRLQPDFWEAHYALGGQLGMHNKIAEACDQFAEVVRLRPDYAGGHLNLGVALMKQGHLDEAQYQFEDALRLEPKDQTAAAYLAEARAAKNKGH